MTSIEGNLMTLDEIIECNNPPGLESLQRSVHSLMKVAHKTAVGELERAWRRGAEAGNWLPIEHAPKDGTVVQLYSKSLDDEGVHDADVYMCFASWNNIYKEWHSNGIAIDEDLTNDVDAENFYATHFQRISKPE